LSPQARQESLDIEKINFQAKYLKFGLSIDKLILYQYAGKYITSY